MMPVKVYFAILVIGGVFWLFFGLAAGVPNAFWGCLLFFGMAAFIYFTRIRKKQLPPETLGVNSMSNLPNNRAQTAQVTLSIQKVQDMGARLIRENWTEDRETLKDFSREAVRAQEGFMMEEVVKISLSLNPLMANRERLAHCVLAWARFQVLVIKPPPAEDLTGLRGQPGITGELKTRLLELYRADEGLQDTFKNIEDKPKNWPERWDDLWVPVDLGYRLRYAHAQVYRGLRLAFGDCPKGSETKDWFEPFVVAMCAFEENAYRRSLGMPSALGPEREIVGRSLLLSLFMDCVLDGARDPFVEWKSRIGDTEKGNHAWRDNSWLA
ncbi:MAG TPA: hypothetical protein VKB38_21130 [Terracidiphilus sp.]|nr:hypothetical protein [Terracidiphilus sp.]